MSEHGEEHGGDWIKTVLMVIGGIAILILAINGLSNMIGFHVNARVGYSSVNLGGGCNCGGDSNQADYDELRNAYK